MSDTSKAFDMVASSYDQWYQQPKGKQVFDVEKNAIDRVITEVGLGLEVGAGTGVFAEILSKSNRTIICLDLSKEMIKIAKGKGLPSILASASKLPIRKASMSFCYMVTVAEFLKDPRLAFHEIKLVLNEHGAFICLFINPESPWGKLYIKLGKDGDPVFRHASLICLEKMSKYLFEVGLKKKLVFGTLIKGPFDIDAGGEIVAPNSSSGVIVIKAEK